MLLFLSRSPCGLPALFYSSSHCSAGRKRGCWSSTQENSFVLVGVSWFRVLLCWSLFSHYHCSFSLSPQLATITSMCLKAWFLISLHAFGSLRCPKLLRLQPPLHLLWRLLQLDLRRSLQPAPLFSSGRTPSKAIRPKSRVFACPCRSSSQGISGRPLEARPEAISLVKREPGDEFKAGEMVCERQFLCE